LKGETWRYSRSYDVSLANMINRLHGAPVIAAWEVQDLDEMWIETFFELAKIRKQEEELQRHRATVANQQSKWKSQYYRQ